MTWMGLRNVSWNKKKYPAALWSMHVIYQYFIANYYPGNALKAVQVQYAAHRMIQQTHMQPVTEQQVVCMWVVWVRNIHPGWHPLQAKMDYRSWLPTSCGSGLLPRTGNNKCKRKVACSSHEFHTDLILQYSISILCWCCFNCASFNDTLQHCSEMRLLNCRASFLCSVS